MIVDEDVKERQMQRIIKQNTDKTQNQREKKKQIKRHSGQGLTNNDYVHQTSCNQEKQTSRQIHRL
jgi:hypothetical protein